MNALQQSDKKDTIKKAPKGKVAKKDQGEDEVTEGNPLMPTKDYALNMLKKKAQA